MMMSSKGYPYENCCSVCSSTSDCRPTRQELKPKYADAPKTFSGFSIEEDARTQWERAGGVVRKKGKRIILTGKDGKSFSDLVIDFWQPSYTYLEFTMAQTNVRLYRSRSVISVVPGT